MRVFLFAAGLLLSAGSPVLAVIVDLSPPPKVLPPAAPKPAPKVDAKANCPCDCPKAHKQARVTKRRHYASAYYHYAAAAPFHPIWRHQESYAAPMFYAPPPSAYEQGLRIDNSGWSGGVGYAPEGGGGGGFVDGYGQVHFPTDVGNGPTYNSYNQSFQFNPSQPGPFQNRLMGGYAPPSNSGSR
jgi:hypothetical protein